jgi:hypothetical protein
MALTHSKLQTQRSVHKPKSKTDEDASQRDISKSQDQALSRTRDHESSSIDNEISRARMEDLQLEQARSDLEALSVTERCGQSESALAAARLALERLRREREEDLDRWQDIAERHKSVLESMQKERQAAEASAEHALRDAEECRTMYNETLGMYNETRGELVEAVKEVNTLRGTCTRFQEQIEQIRGLLGDKEAVVASMKEACARSQEQIDQLRGLLNDKDAVILNLRDACSALGGSAGRINELERLCKEEEAKRKICEASMSESEQIYARQIGTLQNELDRFTAEQVRLYVCMRVYTQCVCVHSATSFICTSDDLDDVG